ncbi:MAG: hypothetical protein ABIG11_09780 [bacterium]
MNHAIRLIVSEKYTVDLGDHIFMTGKFMETARNLVKKNILAESDLLEPEAASREDLLLVHTGEWTNRVIIGGFSTEEEARAELRWSPEMAKAQLLAAGGTIFACRLALETGRAAPGVRGTCPTAGTRLPSVGQGRAPVAGLGLHCGGGRASRLSRSWRGLLPSQ